MKLGITVNMGNYESIKFDSNEYDNSYDCAMELIHEIKKLYNFEVEKYALAYLSPFIHKTDTYYKNGVRSVSIIEKIKKWLKIGG